MSIEPKVSCICITHNRLEMFEKALQCFLAQTYANTELVVLFENDAVTEKYIRENRRYNYYTLRQTSTEDPLFFLETFNDASCPLTERARVSVKDRSGSAFTRIHGVFQFDRDAPSDFNVFVDEFSNNRFSLRYGDRWLNFNADGSFTTVAEQQYAHRYGYTHHLDCIFSLDISSSDVGQNTVERIGWTKELVHAGDVKNVFFYNVLPVSKMSLGMKRNLSIRVASGDYICVWDDDDWYAPHRITSQTTYLRFTGQSACSLAYTILFDNATGRAYYNVERPTGHENSLIFKKEGAGAYGNLNAKEDTPLLASFYNRNQLAVMDDPDLYIYNYHRKNTSSPDHFKKVLAEALPLDELYTTNVRKMLATPAVLP